MKFTRSLFSSLKEHILQPNHLFITSPEVLLKAFSSTKQNTVILRFLSLKFILPLILRPRLCEFSASSRQLILPLFSQPESEPLKHLRASLAARHQHVAQITSKQSKQLVLTL